jgi:hypothetical protein
VPLLKTLEGVSFRMFGGVAPKFLSVFLSLKNTLRKQVSKSILKPIFL